MRDRRLPLLCWLTLAGLLTAAPRPAAAEPRLKLRTRLLVLPQTPRCDGRIERAMTLHHVEQVLEGSYPHRTVLVLHRCPEVPRGPSRVGRGDAGALDPGDRFDLTLVPLDPTVEVRMVDPFAMTDPRPRYVAYRADRAPRPPRMTVVVEGGAGTKIRLHCDGLRATVGRDVGTDVMLNDPTVAERHLELRVRGDKIQLVPVDGALTLVNNAPLVTPIKITFADRITVGRFRLRIALFL